MVELALGSGIALGSLFLALGTVAVVWINNLYKSRQEYGQVNNGGQTPENGYIRRGEHDKSVDSIDKRLENMHEENKSWWKQLNNKVDSLSNQFQEFSKEQRGQNEDFRQRITAIETIQETCPARDLAKKKSVSNE